MMRRGFKAEAERRADNIREELGLQASDPLNIHELARTFEVKIYPADELVDRERLENLGRLQSDAFSAATFHLPNGRTVIVYNPLNEQARTNSDLAHELAHIILRHDVREIQQLAGQAFLTCDHEQEEEANWFAGCLLLPRSLLLHEMYAERSVAAIASRHQVTDSMTKYRLNATGVQLQVRRTQKAKTSRVQ